jgi:hypothetical protein
MKKRGMSQIIATLLIIAIVFVAIAIVWLVIRGILQKGTEEITLSKFTIDLKIETLKIEENTLQAKIKRNPGEGELKGITFLVFDGANTHVFEELDVDIGVLERRTYVLDYSGPITKLSIAPMFETETGRIITGSITDIYYVGAGAGECDDYDCEGKQCGPDGCGGTCGQCVSPTPVCIGGVCQEGNEFCDCSCAENVCEGKYCIGGCGEICMGELSLEEDCAGVMCGPSPHGCGECSTCGSGYNCNQGICAPNCVPDCEGKECGDNGCGGNCPPGCNITTEWCNNGICDPIETCVPNCTIRECGYDNLCNELCGTCNESAGEQCSAAGICLNEQYINNGTVFSVWPIGVGIYFDSEDLPKSGVDYTGYYARFPGSLEIDCLRISEYTVPINPDAYNMSHIRLSTTSTEIQANDKYEIWENYTGCANAP